MTNAADSLPQDVATLQALVLTERSARLEAESKAKHSALLIEKLKYTIAKLRHLKFGQSSERSAILEQLELQLSELEENASQAKAEAELAAAKEKITVASFELRKPGEDVTETLELVPRQWKVTQHVREKMACRSCESIMQPPAPFHPIARG